MAHDVFVSHSSKDKLTADAVCAVLESHGIRCWVAPRDILPGREWGASIIEAIKGAKVMVLIFSAHANSSPQINKEVERAVNKGIPVIPMRIENVVPTESLEYFLSSNHWLDAYSQPLESYLQHLVEVVRQITGQPADEKLPAPTAIPAPIQKTEAPETSEETAVKPAPAAGQPPASRLVWAAVFAIILVSAGGWFFLVEKPRIDAKAVLLRQAEAQRAAQEKIKDFVGKWDFLHSGNTVANATARSTWQVNFYEFKALPDGELILAGYESKNTWFDVKSASSRTIELTYPPGVSVVHAPGFDNTEKFAFVVKPDSNMVSIVRHNLAPNQGPDSQVILALDSTKTKLVRFVVFPENRRNGRVMGMAFQITNKTQITDDLINQVIKRHLQAETNGAIDGPTYAVKVH